VVAGTSEYLAACLIAAGATVDFAHPGELLSPDVEEVDWRPDLHWIPMTLSEPIGRLTDARRLGPMIYDPVVFSQNGALQVGREGFDEAIAAADALLKPNGVLAMASSVTLADQAEWNAAPRNLVEGGHLADGFASATGYSNLRGVDDRVSLM